MQQQKSIIKNDIIKMSQTGEMYKVQSSTDPNVYYIVRMVDSVAGFCTCPDYENRGGAKNPSHVCKHMKMVVAAEAAGTILTVDQAEEARKKNRLQYEDDNYGF